MRNTPATRTLVYIVIGLIPFCLTGCRVAGSHGGPASIKVVRTWGDLLDQPAIGVGDCTAHVGIDALRAPRNSGVLLYCLAKGYSGPHDWHNGDLLGPFTVRVSREGEEDEFLSVGEAFKTGQDISDSTVLFRLSIPLADVGLYHVRVFSPEDKLVASADVTATNEKYHPWMPFDPHTTKLQELEKKDDRYDAVGYVANRERGIAIPHFDGMLPIVFRGAVDGKTIDRPEQEPLPTLFPKVAGEGLKVTVSGSDLIVEADKDIILARPDWHFLARWWVNGTPYIPEQLERFEDMKGMMIVGKRLLLHLDFEPARIGARPSDKVELQLLYCEYGWDLLLPDVLEKLAPFRPAGSPELLLSNRVRLR